MLKNRSIASGRLRSWRAVSSALALCFISGCGGGEGSSSGGPAPAPIPTPTVVPTPAPSPTPTPSASYSSIVDFTKDLFGQSPVAEVTYVDVYDVNAVLPAPYYVYKTASSRLLDSPGAGIFTWDPKEKTASARIGDYFQTFSGIIGEQPPSWSYLESFHNVDGDERSLRWIGKTGSAFAWIDLESRPPCTFPPGEPATCTRTMRYATIGAVTLPGELALTGSSLIDASLSFTLARPEVPSRTSGSLNTRLSIDYAARTVMAQWTSEGQNYILQGDYRPDHHTRLTGTVRSVDGMYSGTFAGNFYGAGAKTVAIVFSAQGDGRGLAGRLIGQMP